MARLAACKHTKNISTLHEQFILCRTNLLAIFIARVHDLFPISKEFEAYFHKTKTEYFLFFEEKAISIVLALETQVNEVKVSPSAMFDQSCVWYVPMGTALTGNTALHFHCGRHGTCFKMAAYRS